MMGIRMCTTGAMSSRTISEPAEVAWLVPKSDGHSHPHPTSTGRTLGLREARGQVVDTRDPCRERGMGRAGSGALE